MDGAKKVRREVRKTRREIGRAQQIGVLGCDPCREMAGPEK